MGSTVPGEGRSPFDPPIDQLVEMGGEAVDFAARFVEDRYTAPNADMGDLEELLGLLGASPPSSGRSFQDLLELVGQAAAKGFDPAAPGFMAYIPGGGLYASALGDFLACVVNRYTGLARPAPALVQLEQSVLRWLCDLFGLPSSAQGLLTPGGSMSTFAALVTARESRLGEHFLDGALYVSDEAYHSVAKAAKIAGFPADAVRVVPAVEALRFDPEALGEAVRRDRAAGRRPFLVVASAGTINAGMVDPLDAVADVAERENLWLHVDAAYGGFFQLTDRGRAALRGIERADTVTLDPHKGLFLPYGTGCLLARDGATLRAAHDVAAHYLPDVTDGLPDFAAYGPELTRDFRGLRIWLPFTSTAPKRSAMPSTRSWTWLTTSTSTSMRCQSSRCRGAPTCRWSLSDPAVAPTPSACGYWTESMTAVGCGCPRRPSGDGCSCAPASCPTALEANAWRSSLRSSRMPWPPDDPRDDPPNIHMPLSPPGRSTMPRSEETGSAS